MSEPKAPAEAICDRCRSAMKLVTRIAPFGQEPGLVAYECPSCGAVRSVLIPVQERDDSRRHPDR